MEFALIFAAWVAIGAFGQYLLYLLMWKDFKGRRMSIDLADLSFFTFIATFGGPLNIVAAIFVVIFRGIKSAFRASGIRFDTVLIKGEE
ncbi:hypothetical protein EN837_08515 [bacterium M00.F.Ca.ET.194.01.1.1]|nr:hypothetical protein EN837_08515 [bacterium M00.F.Ca.ET.194.01.1.1]TGS56301.1 hypothetical protein EN822_08515 [bacterium M00.F.Ca.ET.179.01.1.1]TGV49206.1 hypothetical protein EN811_08515 [bacterium M00.F.Ca.ET.168.01.1.1]